MPAGIDVGLAGRATVTRPPSNWDSLLTADDFFLSTPWLEVVRRTAGIPMHYLLRHRSGELVAGLSTALLDGAAPWLLGRPDTLLTYSESQGHPGAAACLADLAAPAAALLPSLVCGGRHLGRTRIPHTSAATRADLADLVDAAEAMAVESGARSLSYLYLDERDSRLREMLLDRGYRHHVSGHYCWLPLPGGGFDGYLAGLSAHRARRVRAERRQITRAGVDIRTEPLTHPVIGRLAELETNLFAKYGMTDWRPERSAHFLHEVLDVFGDRAVVSLARAADAIRGFGLLLRFGNHWHAHRAGFDYNYQRKLPLYYEVLYYHPADAAEDHGITTIHYGVGSTEAKLLRGCQASPQYSHFKSPMRRADIAG